MPIYSLCVTAADERLWTVRIVDAKLGLPMHASPWIYTVRINMKFVPLHVVYSLLRGFAAKMT